MWQAIVRAWRGLFRQEVVHGDPESPLDLATRHAQDFPEIPPFDWVRLILTNEGGWRLLLLCWLVNVTLDDERFYQPLLWLEYVPAGESHGRHGFLSLTIPPDHGQLTCVVPLSLETLRVMGPLAVRYESWRGKQGQQDKDDPRA